MEKNISRAKELRSRSTDAEKHLWSHLRNRNFLNLKFRRQHPVGIFIADLACLEIGLVIELDGGQHVERREYDDARDSKINDEGFEVVRFWDNEVLLNTEGVLERLMNICLNKIKAFSSGQGE